MTRRLRWLWAVIAINSTVIAGNAVTLNRGIHSLAWAVYVWCCALAVGIILLVTVLRIRR